MQTAKDQNRGSRKVMRTKELEAEMPANAEHSRPRMQLRFQVQGKVEPALGVTKPRCP